MGKDKRDAPEREKLSWAKRRDRRISAIRVALALLTSLALAAALAIAMQAGWIEKENLFRFLFFLVQPYQLILELLALFGIELESEEFLRFLVEGYPFSSVFPISFLVFLLAYYKAGTGDWINDRFFAQFNDDVLAPVGRAKPYDPLWGTVGPENDLPPLPWILPGEGPRKEVWDQLMGFVSLIPTQGESETDSPEPPRRFGWTILVGRPGSGKSRMAVELARHLARRDRFSDLAMPAVWWPRLKWRLANGVARAAEWRRIHLSGDFRWDLDAWDAGWLEPEHALFESVDSVYGPRSYRQAVRETSLEKLAHWLPRRPTLLLSDDPSIGDAREILGRLDVAAERWRHPVRMLVVNQTIPAELRLRPVEGQDKGWFSEYLQPLVDPVVYLDAARFSAADIRTLRYSVLLRDNTALATDDKVDRFMEVTRGNPLLVELGLRWLAVPGHRLHELTRERLLTERVKRIFEALETVGWDKPKYHMALAAATVASGSFSERPGNPPGGGPRPMAERSGWPPAGPSWRASAWKTTIRRSCA